MKYKNYINSYTKDNRIFSKEDISNMTVRDAYGNKRAIIAQNRKIGVPSDAELRNSSNVIWINPYKRDDGTPVKGHWRSKSGTGGIAGDEAPVIMDETVKSDSDVLSPDNQTSQDEESGDEDISPVSAIIDVIVAIMQLIFKDSEIGEIVQAIAPILKVFGEKIFGDDSETEETDSESEDSEETSETESEPTEEPEPESEPELELEPEGALTGGAAEISSIKHDGIVLKPSAEITDTKNKLIEYNNTQNANNKDARELMNIAIIGTNNIENSRELSILNDADTNMLSNDIGYDLSNGNKTVKFKDCSTIANAVNSSEYLKDSIKKWLDMPVEERPDTIQVQLADNENLFYSINNATVLKPRIENGYFHGYLYDKYDFKLQWFKNAKTLFANTGAVTLQTIKQLEKFNIIIPIKIKLKRY